MTSNKLPEGWQEVELGDVLDYEQPSKYIVSSEGYDDGYKTPVLTAGKSFILGYTDEKEGIYNKPPVIIFDDFTADIKYVDFPFKVKSSAMKMLTPKNKNIDLKFIFLLMKTIKFDATTHKRYYLSSFSRIRVPLPSLPIQKSIVSILEKAEALKKKREEADKLTKEYLQSVFYEMFGSKRWDLFKIEDLAEVRGRVGWKGYTKGDLRDSGPLVLGATHITDDGDIDITYPVYLSEEKYEESPEIKVQKYDLIFSQRGSLGLTGLIKNNFGKATINPCVLIIRPKKINPYYFNQLFNYNEVRKKIVELGRSTSIPMITQKDIKNFSIPLPPLPLQQKFASIVEKVEKLKEKQKESKDKIDDLFNVLMQKAFKGELIK